MLFFCFLLVLSPCYDLFAGGGNSKQSSFKALPDIGSESWNVSSGDDVLNKRFFNKCLVKDLVAKNDIFKKKSKRWNMIAGYVQRLSIDAENAYVEMERKINTPDFIDEAYRFLFQEKVRVSRLFSLLFDTDENIANFDLGILKSLLTDLLKIEEFVLQNNDIQRLRILSDQDVATRLI